MRPMILAASVLAPCALAHDPPQLLPFVGEAGTYHHEPQAALAAGSTAVVKQGSEYHFTFTGDETVRYVLDMSSWEAQHGVLRVREDALSGGTYPVAAGGLEWIHLDRTVEEPYAFAANAGTHTLLVHESRNARCAHAAQACHRRTAVRREQPWANRHLGQLRVGPVGRAPARVPGHADGPASCPRQPRQLGDPRLRAAPRAAQRGSRSRHGPGTGAYDPEPGLQ